MIEKELIAFLLSEGSLVEMVSDRIWDDVLPQSPTLPALVWQRISTERFHSQSGPVGLAHPRFQFTCWAKTRLETIQMANIIRKALDGYHGMMGAEEVPAVFSENERDDIDPETGLRRTILEYFIWHKE